mgnify:CR=1 FL=1
MLDTDILINISQKHCTRMNILDRMSIKMIFYENYNRNKSNIKFNSLGQWKGSSIIYGTSGSSHILFPWVGSRFSTTSSFLFSSEGSSDFSPTGSNIDIYNSAVRSQRSSPLEKVLEVIGEKRGWKSLRNIVVVLNGFFQSLFLNIVTLNFMM